MNLGITETTNRMWYEWYLAGPDGANFILYPEPKHTPDDRMEAKKWLKNNHDAVRITLGNYALREKEIYKQAVNDVNNFQKNHNIKL